MKKNNNSNNSNPSDFPKDLQLINEAPKGFHWEYRGKRWMRTNVMYACTDDGYWSYADKPCNAQGCDYHYAELVKDDIPTVKTATFIVRTWKEWVDNISKNIQEQLNEGKITLRDIIDGNRLDPDDPSLFLNSWMFMNIFEEKVFVEHATAKDCYWYIRTDTANLVDYPKHN